MADAEDAPEQPVSHGEIRRVIDDVVGGRISREDASRWAFAALDAVERSGDEVGADALDALLGMDLVQVDEDMRLTGYLEDFYYVLRERARLDP